MAGRGGAPNTADSYIGSLISLTSKSEIRYEGILYTVDTENSNIAFQNVRSFGTEGRKKDGPQIPASEKVYDYIIFRGSDIKDLQVKSAPPPLQPLPPPPQPTDPAIISLQSQPHYLPPPSSLGYNGGAPGAGPSMEPSAPPPPPYMEMPPNQYQGPVPPPLYPPGGLQSWGPPPPPGGNAMPMYWQPYHRPPPPVGHMQHQPMPPQPPPSLAPPPQGQQQGAPLLPQPPPTLFRPLPPGGGPSSSAGAGLASHSQAASSSSSAQVTSSAAPAASAAPLIPSAPLITATTTPASNLASSSVSAVSSSASPAASSIGTTASSGAPVSASSSLPTSIQGVSAVITPMRSDPRRSAGMVSQGPQVSSAVDGGSSSQGLRTQNISSGLIRAPREAAQSSGIVGPNARAGVSAAQQQAAPKVEQKAVEPANVASSAMMQTPSQGAPGQEQVSQPLLPLPSGEQKAQQPMAQQRGGQGGPGGQRNRWQGNGYAGNGNFNRRGRGRGNGNNNGRGVGMANPARKFTEDFDFTAMNEKFNKTEVWGELGGGKVENAAEEEEYEDDEHVEVEIPEPETDKKALYKKDDFFDELSCDALDRERERGERTKFSEQRKIDTETFGAFPVRSRGRGGRGGRGGGYRGGYFGGGGGSYGIGRGGNGYGRGRGSGRPGSAIP